MTAGIKILRGLVLTATFAALTSACVSTKLVKEWGDPSRNGPGYRKVMVMAIWTEAGVRRTFEDTFADQVKAAGIDAVPSYRFIPQDGKVEREVVVKAVEDSGADALILVKCLGRGERGRDYQTGPMYGGTTVVVSDAYGAYAVAWTNYYTPPASADQSVWTFQTKVFDKKSQALVWDGIAELTNPEGLRKGTADLARLVVKALAARKML